MFNSNFTYRLVKLEDSKYNLINNMFFYFVVVFFVLFFSFTFQSLQVCGKSLLLVISSIQPPQVLVPGLE